MSGWHETGDTALLDGKALAADLRDAVCARAAVLANSKMKSGTGMLEHPVTVAGRVVSSGWLIVGG
ncbi:MAG: hypothetical protein ACRDRK_19820 [Pseudonocardia sp.]